jgi:hypothetical protein
MVITSLLNTETENLSFECLLLFQINIGPTANLVARK